jgi:hypothetical protein
MSSNNEIDRNREADEILRIFRDPKNRKAIGHAMGRLMDAREESWNKQGYMSDPLTGERVPLENGYQISPLEK